MARKARLAASTATRTALSGPRPGDSTPRGATASAMDAYATPDPVPSATRGIDQAATEGYAAPRGRRARMAR
jgi:hypothetical protein